MRVTAVTKMLGHYSMDPARDELSFQQRVEGYVELTSCVPWLEPPPRGETPSGRPLFLRAVSLAIQQNETSWPPSAGQIIAAAKRIAGYAHTPGQGRTLRVWARRIEEGNAEGFGDDLLLPAAAGRQETTK